MLLGEARQTEDLGRCFGSDLYEVEVRYLIDHEWARRADDVLWRRTKEGLRLTRDQAALLEAYMAALPAEMAG
jgi:glycerol-3-phosphate dehydrogenase